MAKLDSRSDFSRWQPSKTCRFEKKDLAGQIAPFPGQRWPTGKVSWLLRAIAGSPGDLQIMYGIAGERRLTELELSWLSGYEDSSPVRIGNAAHEQFQLDVYGEMMDAAHLASRSGANRR